MNQTTGNSTAYLHVLKLETQPTSGYVASAHEFKSINQVKGMPVIGINAPQVALRLCIQTVSSLDACVVNKT